MRKSKKLTKWFHNKYCEYFPLKYSFVEVKGSPIVVPENIVLIINEGYQPDRLVFKCPCNCGAEIHLNLLKKAYPYWKYHITNKNKINISPSILRIVGCHSHFFIKNSKVVWF